MNAIHKIFVVFVLASIGVIFPHLLSAQWNTNTFVNLEISGLVTADMVSVPTTDGKTWIAFYHENSGNYDMRAQLIDADGYKLLGPNGVLVSNQPSSTAIYVFNACVDNSNNLIIGCQDQRTGTMQSVLYKISQAGNHLWNSNGVILGAGLAPYPAALSNNDIVVAWNDDASGTLKLQKITAAGAVAWTNPVSIMVGGSTTTRGQIVGNMNEKFTVVYQKYAGGIATNLYAQMFNSSGTALYNPLQICNQTTAPYRYYSITSIADTTYYGYYSSTGFRFNSFVQRINPNGTIPWGMNGSAFNTHTSGSDNYQMETSIGLDPNSPFIWSVCSFCDPNQTNYGVYVQKFLRSTGARQFTDWGKQVYAISANRDTKAGEIVIVDDNPMFASYDNDYKIYGTRLDGNGDFIWPGNRVELSSTVASPGVGKGRFGFTAIGPDRCAVVWTEDRGSGDYAYAQGISVGGLIGIDVTTQGGIPATITLSGGTLQLVATVYPLTANQDVYWSIIPVTGFATISTTGLVTGVADGTVWAKAISQQDPTMADSLLITMTGQVPVPPTVVTLAATDITLEGSTINGSVTANNFNSTASFEWGLTTSYGNTIAATPSQVTGNTPAAVHASLNGLTPGTTYHYRCVAINTGGTTNGADLTFTTLCLLPGTLGTITGPASLCAGTTGATYSVNPIAGATAYVWTLPQGATITAGNNTNMITVSYSPTAQSGDMSVYATDGTCISLPSAMLSVTVIPLPGKAGPINGIQVVCEGDENMNYSVDLLPGVSTYVWTVPDGAAIVSGQNTNAIVVDYLPGSVSGNITVYGTNTCGTGLVSDPLPITVNALPGTPGAISGPDHVCKEAYGIEYSVAPVSNAFSYEWSLPAGAEITAGGGTNQITVHFAPLSVSGTVSVLATNGNCIGEVSPALSVTVDPIPPTPAITRHGDTLVSSAETGNQWYLEGVVIPGATGQEYIVQVAGNYMVIVTLNDCSSAPSSTILVLPTGMDSEFNASSVQIFPIPSSGIITVKFSGEVVTDLNLTVINTSGQLVLEIPHLCLDPDGMKRIDLTGLPRGMYMLKLKDNKHEFTCKIFLKE